LIAGPAANVSFPHNRQARCDNASASPCCPLVPPDGHQRVSAGSRANIFRPVVSVERTGARGRTARPDGHRRLAKMAPVQEPSPPSRPTCGPSRRLLLLPLQEQVDPLSDEGRGGPVSRVRDKLPHEVPRRLIHAEGEHSRLSCHSHFSFA